MDHYKYNVTSIDPESIILVDNLSLSDDELILDFKINSSFNSSTDYIELHYYTLDGRLLSSIDYYTNYKTNQDSETADGGTLNTVSLGIEDDIIVGGFRQGDVNVIYNFLTDPYTENYLKTFFFIEEISSDRTEIRLLPVTLQSQEVIDFTTKLKQTLENPSTGDLKMNFGDNRLLLALNVDTLPYREYNSVVVKLYNSLPGDIEVKDKVSIVLEVSDPAAFNVSTVLVEEPTKVTYLKGPNFKVDGDVNTSFPSEYLSIQEAFNYQVTSSYYQVKSIFEEKGAELSIDYSDYNNFINFSSAEERLKNFKYKVDLISSYQSDLDSSTTYTSLSLIYSGSKSFYEGLINNILSNFDHYDRFLYYESSSYSWPKSGTRQPYTLITGSAVTGSGNWYELQTVSASLFDSTNSNLLLNTIPTFLRDDPDNDQYTIFVNMVAQHFDNIWIYAKAVTEKYNSDNRLNVGISKDLIDDALRNFGVKLYTSNKSTQELFRMFTGDFYEISADEFGSRISSASFITGSDLPTSEENYRKEIFKRLYHNLPLILKSKGTERGVRALLSSFGIPSLYSVTSGSILPVQQYGGTLTSDSNFGGQSLISSSEDKIRLDNTGSIIGNTLSAYTSIIKRNEKYSQDTNLAEIGFSPTTYINELILASGSLEDFNIDQILGDPGFAFSSSYEGLTIKAEQYLSGSITERYNLKDFTRLLKFYDNVLFKTVKDFLPGKLDTSTGIIIKPHLLERSKVPQVRATLERHNNLSASIEVGNIAGSSGDTFGGQDQYTSSYISQEMSPDGLTPSEYHNHETAKYDGEFSGSYLRISTGELNDENTFKYDSSVPLTFSYNFIDADLDCNIIFGEWQPPISPVCQGQVTGESVNNPLSGTICQATVTGENLNNSF